MAPEDPLATISFATILPFHFRGGDYVVRPWGRGWEKETHEDLSGPKAHVRHWYLLRGLSDPSNSHSL